MGKVVGDVVITRDEIEGLMAGLLYVKSPPSGNTKLAGWIREHRDTLGLRYTSFILHLWEPRELFVEPAYCKSKGNGPMEARECS